MSDKQTSLSVVPTLHETTDASSKKITHELVMAIADRIYGMLLRELKIERERQRVLNDSRRK